MLTISSLFDSIKKTSSDSRDQVKNSNVIDKPPLSIKPIPTHLSPFSHLSPSFQAIIRPYYGLRRPCYGLMKTIIRSSETLSWSYEDRSKVFGDLIMVL